MRGAPNDPPLADCHRLRCRRRPDRAGVAVNALHLPSADADAYVSFDADAILIQVAAHDAPCQDAARLHPTPDQADALALAFAEWAARARARAGRNAQPELFGFLP